MSVSSSHSKKHRTLEEQAAHDKRKERHRAAKAKAKATESESAVTDEPATEPAIESAPLVIPRRMSSRRYSSTKSTNSHASKDENGTTRPKFLDMKNGESVVKVPFVATEEPHVKETVKEVVRPVMDRPRWHSSKYHSHSHSHRKGGGRERHRTEVEKEASRERRETEKKMKVVQEEIAEEARRQRERDDEDRRVRREARRKKRAAEEKAEKEKLAVEKEKLAVGKGKGRSTNKEKDKEKSTLKSLWSMGKKAFAS
jgi:hypothetical protein